MMSLKFACPAPLRAQGMAMRTECAADLPALRALFRAQRWAEFAMLPWDDAAKQAMLDQQFDAQQRHYASTHAQRLFMVLTDRGHLAGRLYLGQRRAEELCVMDILLSPDHRGRGIGTMLISAVLDHAYAMGQCVSLEVDKRNPAATLYRSLGFSTVADTGIGWRMTWLAAAPRV